MKLIKFVLLAVSLFSIDTTSAVVIRRTTKKITRTKSIEIPTIGKPIATCIQCVDCVDCEANPQMAINCPHTCMKKPIKPIEPIRPIDPIKPIKPIEPIRPIDPIKPIKPIEPIRPIDPIKPIKPIEPIRPIDPIKPIKPIEPIRPIDPIEPPTEPIYCIQCVGCVDCEKNPQMAINCPGTCKQNYLKEI